jgi:peptide/nickel transport system ATP-binding protein
MQRLKEEHQTSIILITHDMGVIAELADDVVVMYMGSIVEKGTVREVLQNPSHPYTKALLESIPILGRGKKQKIEPIRGATPDPYQRPEGCQFLPRCDYASEECKQFPPDQQITVSHSAKCWKSNEVLNNV